MKIEIEKVASLARLELTEQEKGEYTRQLTDIIEYVEKIKELDTSAIEPADHITDVKNVFRKDLVKKSLDRDAIEKNAPSFENGHFVVPKIIE